MSKKPVSPARMAIDEIEPPQMVAYIGREAGDYPARDFFIGFDHIIAATVLYVDLEHDSREAEAVYIGGGSRKRPRPTLSDALNYYAMTVGELQDVARVQYPESESGVFDEARLRWQDQYAGYAADVGLHLVAAHVVCAGRQGIADAFVYPRSVGERVGLAAREELVEGLPHLSAEQRAVAQPALSRGPGLQEAATLLLASVMPSSETMQLMSEHFYR